MSETNSTEIKYDAFISYRHSELDMFVAKTLHREMEAFRLPGNIAKKVGDNGKTRITRVFRDKDELPLASNLAEPIQVALAASDFLVVICSPRLPESAWCKKEIETFLEMKDRDHILAVLIEGEPYESFPEILCYDHGVPIEPLAADVRGKNQREIKKKIKQEIIRLAAPMFGCAYDDLKQRHREQKIKRALTLCGIGSAICLLFGTISTSMALTIKSQNNEISKQSEQIMAQKDEIEKQYTQAMISNAQMTAKEALSLLDNGDRVGAVQKVRSVMPNTKTDSEMPYVDEAEYALCQALQPYANGNNLLAKETLQHDTNVSFMKISPDRKHLITVDDAALITIWEIETGKAVLRIEDFMSEVMLDENQIAFLDDNHIACLQRDNFINDGPRVHIIEINTGEETSISAENAYYLFSDGNGQFVVMNSNYLQLYKDGQVQGTWSQEDEYLFSGNACVYNEDGTKIAFAQHTDDDTCNGRVLVVDTATGEVTNCYATEYDLFKELRFVGDTLYVVNNQSLFEITRDFGEAVANHIATNGRLSACNLNTYDEIRWEYEAKQLNLAGVISSGSIESNMLLVNGYSDVFAVNALDGSLISMYSFDDQIIETGSIKDSEWFVAYTQNGNINMLQPVDNQLIAAQSGVTDAFQVSSLKQIYSGGGYIISLANYDTDITLWSYLRGEDVTECINWSESIYDPRLCQSKNLLLQKCYSDPGYALINTTTGEQQYSINISMDFANDSAFVGEEGDTIAILSGNHVELFKTEDGTALKQYETENMESESFFGGTDNNLVIMTYDEKIDILDTITGELLHELPLEKSMNVHDCIAVNASGSLTAISQSADKNIVLYSTEDGRKLFDLPIRASFISKIFFHSAEADQLFVIYKDNTVDVYQVDNEQLNLFHKFPAFNSAPQRISEGKDGYYALLGSSAGYYMYGIEILAEVPDLMEVQWEQQEFLTRNDKTVYKMPIYSYEELIQKSDAFIKQHAQETN